MSVLDELGQDIMPEIFAELSSAGLADTMTIQAESLASDNAGGQIKTTSNAYTNIPVTWKAKEIKRRATVGDKQVSVQEYLLEFPTHTSAGAKISLDPKTHRLIVNARGNEIAKTFRIISIRDNQGVTFEAICEKEN
jgi:hypothetical protein